MKHYMVKHMSSHDVNFTIAGNCLEPMTSLTLFKFVFSLTNRFHFVVVCSVTDTQVTYAVVCSGTEMKR